MTLANELYKLQEPKNNGRGVSCVRTVVAYLERCDRVSAIAVCRNEGDKIRSYPDIWKYVCNNIVDLEPRLRI